MNGVPMIEILLKRLSKSKRIDKIVLATCEGSEFLVDHVKSLGFPVFMGMEDDCLDRYFHAAAPHHPDLVIRITGDCPLVDAQLVDEIIEAHGGHYTSNTIPATYPDGLDVEVFTYSKLQHAWFQATSEYDRENVTPYMKDGGKNIANDEDLSDLRWTVDEPEDFETVENIFRELGFDCSWREVLELNRTKPELFTNGDFTRNSPLNRGQKLNTRAAKVISGGFLSKSAGRFPVEWPLYFIEAKGCKVWDTQGQEFTDMGLMGVGTNVLGYGHPEVDEAVREAIHKGNMSSLNCVEELLLAEKLIDMHPWADKVRFARTGGEACAIAVKLARGYALARGYHGWHLQDLDRFETIEEVMHMTGGDTIITEVEGYTDLLELREYCTKNGVTLIFDEVSSGFRETFGGIYQKYDVEPDMVVYGKALGNGYGISAVVMKEMEESFISSTFWSDRIGPAAALATLKVMERDKTWLTIARINQRMQDHWRSLGLEVTGNTFKTERRDEIITGMLDKGYLVDTRFYACIDHERELDEYFTKTDILGG